MNDYTGKICPFCKTEFKPSENIVICSECDMPHHKDCWIENQGCTTFGCLGTIKSADNTATSVTATQMNYDDIKTATAGVVVYCTKCGTQNSATSSFCSKCGNRLTTEFQQERQAPVYTQANHTSTNPYAYVNQQSNYYSNGYSGYQLNQSVSIDAEIQQLIGPKAEYYVPKFQELKSQNKQTSWNWHAFLVAPYWMIYRKMYGYGATLLGISFIISLIGSGVLSLLSFSGYVAIGIFANSIYMRFLENKVTQIKSMTEPYRSQYISQNCGVNTTATLLTVIGYALLMIILSAQEVL